MPELHKYQPNANSIGPLPPPVLAPYGMGNVTVMQQIAMFNQWYHVHPSIVLPWPNAKPYKYNLKNMVGTFCKYSYDCCSGTMMDIA